MKQILLVEDNHIAQKVAILNLRSENCEVDIVETAGAALNAVTKKNYDVVLLDIGLPDGDGYDLAKQIRQAGHRSLAIVGLSAQIGDLHKQRCREVGMRKVYAKPLTRDIVQSILAL